jgi:hypothetical protein
MTTPAEPTTKSPIAVAEKHATSKSTSEPTPKFDAFHPEMPQIPGVNQRPGKVAGPDTSRSVRIGGIVAAILVIGVALLWWIEVTLRPTAKSPAPEDTIAESSVPAPAFPTSAAPGSEGLTVAATVEELSKPWSAKKFIFVKPFTGGSVDAIVIRLPGGGLWAISLQEPYGRCKLEYVTDLGRLETQFGYHAGHPMVVNPCNRTVYDPLKIGSLGGNVLARGEIVKGGGLRPPISINVQVKGQSIIADGIE